MANTVLARAIDTGTAELRAKTIGREMFAVGDPLIRRRPLSRAAR
jgi:hypothetical protein